MFNLLMMLLIIFFISLIVMNISSLISLKNLFNMKKNSPFECGFDPISSARVPFSLQFYLIMIIFLIFDVELVLLIPMINSLQISNIITWIITSMILIVVLLMGIYFEWAQGLLNWSI